MFKQPRLGTDLVESDRRHVLAAYCHRFTVKHRPAWACQPMPNGNTYRPHFADDSDWLAHTSFATRTNGRLDRRFSHCFSRPTWPQNPEMR